MNASFTADGFTIPVGESDQALDSYARPGGATRGIAWVLRWAAAGGVLCFSTAVLAEYTFCLAAELTLLRAARAGALEATLPRATQRTVAETVARRLAGFPHANGHWRLALWQNDEPILGRLAPHPGDRLTVSISIPRRGVLPGWLSALKCWGGQERLEARAVRHIPARRLRSLGRRPA